MVRAMLRISAILSDPGGIRPAVTPTAPLSVAAAAAPEAESATAVPMDSIGPILTAVPVSVTDPNTAAAASGLEADRDRMSIMLPIALGNCMVAKVLTPMAPSATARVGSSGTRIERIFPKDTSLCFCCPRLSNSRAAASTRRWCLRLPRSSCTSKSPSQSSSSPSTPPRPNGTMPTPVMSPASPGSRPTMERGAPSLPTRPFFPLAFFFSSLSASSWARSATALAIFSLARTRRLVNRDEDMRATDDDVPPRELLPA
mmetsp:Transcript_54041/g.161747  ORF Transcript_54041/g.161747 Transcript_54041/m.161747 type:complete len:258 (-) Transcript_54041:1497-2270(-)